MTNKFNPPSASSYLGDSRHMKKTLKYIGICLLTLLGLQVGIVLYLCYEMSDARLHVVVTELLSSILETDFHVNKVSFKPFGNSIEIYGFELKDQKHQNLLKVDTLKAKIHFFGLLHQEVIVNSLHLAGATAELYKAHPDSAANYQFVLDALPFSGQKEHQKKTQHSALLLDLNKITVSRTSAKWDILSEDSLNTKNHKELDVNHLWVNDLNLGVSLQSGGYPGSFVGVLDYLQVDEQNSNTTISISDFKFNAKQEYVYVGNIGMVYQDKHLQVHDLKADYSKTQHTDSIYLNINSICFENGIGVPTRPFNPKRGAFDAKHVKLNLSLQAAAAYMSADSIAIQVHHLTGKDETSGLPLDDLSFTLYKNRKHALVSDFYLKSKRNSISTKRIDIQLPTSGDTPKPWSFQTQTVHMHAVLQDISQAFTPALQNFTTPLDATTQFYGEQGHVSVKNLQIHSHGQLLHLQANGNILLPKHKGEKVELLFHINKLNAKNKIKQQILSHFIKSDKTLDFLNDLNDMTFQGNLRIPYHKVFINGEVGTHFGPINADVLLNAEDAFLTGKIEAQEFQLGTFLNNNNLGPISVQADVKMDISSKAKAKILNRTKGKIPMGTLTGKALTASYLGFKLHNVSFNIKSDGKAAAGSLETHGKLLDLSCDFSFDDSNIKESLVAKPHLKLHKRF